MSVMSLRIMIGMIQCMHGLVPIDQPSYDTGYFDITVTLTDTCSL